MTELEDPRKELAARSRDWSSLNPQLSPWILDAVASMGFTSMTPVQASTIPLFMGYKDVVVEAVTGSGKTLSFLIPVVEKILALDVPTKTHHIASIIIAPTRELAIQIESVLRTLVAFHAPSAAAQRSHEGDADEDTDEDVTAYTSTPRIVSQLLVSGATSPGEDLRQFLERSPNTLVATPGRLVELLSSPRVHCPQSSFEVLVLDEADRLLDLGFKDDLQRILSYLPKQRRTGLFSASVSEALDQLIRVGLRNPIRVSVKVRGTSGKHDQRTPASLNMSYVVAPASKKLPTLLKILSGLEQTPLKTIMYMSTCASVDYFQHVLSPILAEHKPSFSLISLHGKHTPQVRQKNFNRFSEMMSPSILLTTDVAARGLDIPQVDLVVQIDPPLDPKMFLHRCGRAGRAGRKGMALLFLRPGREEDYIPFLNVRKTPIQPLHIRGLQCSKSESVDFAERIRSVVRKDRALHEKAQRGFVSWCQSYRKHQARSIFQVQDIDWADAAGSWGLLKMPKMPELKNWGGDPSLGLEVDWDSLHYKDKQRERQRQSSHSQTPTHNSTDPTVARPTKRAWSVTLDQKNSRERRKTKKRAKRDHDKWENMTAEEREKHVEVQRLVEKAKSYQKEENPFEGFSD